MTVHAGVGDIATLISLTFSWFLVWDAVRRSSHFRHFLGESNPVGIIHGNRLTVFTTTPRRKYSGASDSANAMDA